MRFRPKDSNLLLIAKFESMLSVAYLNERYHINYLHHTKRMRGMDVKRLEQQITNGKKNIIGNNVEKARKKAGISQEQLSARLEVHGLPICRDSICRIERGSRQVTDYEVFMIAHVLGIPVEMLFYDLLLNIASEDK